MINMLAARRRILLAKQSGATPCTDMVLLINSSNSGDFSVATNYGTFTAAKVSEYPYFDTTVTHKLSISGVTFSTGRQISNYVNVRRLFVGVESWGTSNTYTKTSNLFLDHPHLRGIPDSWEGLVNVTNVSNMFYYCPSLTNCGTIFTGLAMATDVSYLFSECTGMRGDIHALYVYLSTKPVAVSSFSDCFRNCTQAVGYESIPASWK